MNWLSDLRKQDILKTAEEGLSAECFMGQKVTEENKPLLKTDTKECLHYFDYGYVADIIIYCRICKKEVDDLYGIEVYRTHELKDGKLVKIK